MSKLRVLFEAGPVVDGRKTGVGYYVSHMIVSLGKEYGHELTLRGYYFDFLQRKRKRAPSFEGVSFCKIWLVPGKLLSLCRRLGFQPYLDFFTPTKDDIIFFTNYVVLPTLNKKRTVVLAIYDLSFMDHPEYTQSVNLRFMRRFCAPSIRQADIIVTISEFTRERLLHHFPGLRAEIVVTPIPPMPMSGSAEPLGGRITELGIESNKYILYLGTIEPRKNIQALVKAFAELPDELQQEYSLVLAGGKGWKDEAILAEIQKQQARGLHIIQTGYISDAEKASLYAYAACFVLPSHYEGFGMPILEAMQHGLPVALSDIPVFHEVAGDAALYFDKDKPADIAETISLLLTDQRQRTALTKKAAAQLQRFSWEDNSRLLYEAFRNSRG